MKPLICTLALLVYSCAGVDLIDDYVPPTLRIVNAIEELPLGSSFQLNASYFNAVGDRIQEAQIQWKSLDPDIITVQPNGTLTPIQKGTAELVAQTTTEEGVLIESKITITVISNVIVNDNPTAGSAEMETHEEMETERPSLEITTLIAEIFEQTRHQIEVNFLNVSQDPLPELNWSSSDESVLEVDENGVITAVQTGVATITVSALVSDTLLSAVNSIQVIPLLMEPPTSYSGTVETKSGYVLEGSFTLSKTEEGLLLALGEDYRATSTLPGLYIYLSNNNNTTAQAYEIGAVNVFSGAHSYLLPSSIELMDYQYILYWCKPFNVKVGEAKIYD
jgi:hypothetical protein